MKRRCLALVGFFLLVVNAGSVRADAIAASSIHINWTQVAISGGTVTPTWWYDNPISMAERNGVFAPDQWLQVGSSTGPSTVGVTNDFFSPHVIGSAMATPSALDVTAYARAAGTSVASGWATGWTNGDQHRGVAFTLQDAATVTISVPYEMHIHLSLDAIDGTEWASGWTYLILRLSQGSTLLDSSSVDFPRSLSGAPTLDFDTAGVLSVTNVLTAGNYYFEVQDQARANAQSSYRPQVPIPEPASLLLLGTGLIGAVRAARRQRR